MFRFSLRIVFAVVALVAVVLYSVINYSPWLCTVYCNVLGIALVIAAVAAITSQGAIRAFGAGFLAAALFCTWTAFAKFNDIYYLEPSFPERLAIHTVIDWVFDSVHGHEGVYTGGNRPRILLSDGTEAISVGEAYVTEDGRRFYSRAVFETMAHCLLAIVLGLIAGAAAAVFWSAADRRRTCLTSRQSLGAVRSEAEPRNEKAEVPGP